MLQDVATKARQDLKTWQETLATNVLGQDDLAHSMRYYFPEKATRLLPALLDFGAEVAQRLEPIVALNNLDTHLPTLEPYNALGEKQQTVCHHPSYTLAGDIIYGSGLMAHLARPGGLLECLSFFLLSSHAGEAGHNCPIACSAGIIRLLQMFPE